MTEKHCWGQLNQDYLPARGSREHRKLFRHLLVCKSNVCCLSDLRFGRFDLGLGGPRSFILCGCKISAASRSNCAASSNFVHGSLQLTLPRLRRHLPPPPALSPARPPSVPSSLPCPSGVLEFHWELLDKYSGVPWLKLRTLSGN